MFFNNDAEGSPYSGSLASMFTQPQPAAAAPDWSNDLNTIGSWYQQYANRAMSGDERSAWQNQRIAGDSMEHIQNVLQDYGSKYGTPAQTSQPTAPTSVNAGGFNYGLTPQAAQMQALLGQQTPAPAPAQTSSYTGTYAAPGQNSIGQPGGFQYGLTDQGQQIAAQNYTPPQMTSGGNYTFDWNQVGKNPTIAVNNNGESNANNQEANPTWQQFTANDGTPLIGAQGANGLEVQKAIDLGGTGFTGQKLSLMNGLPYDVYGANGTLNSTSTRSGYTNEGVGDALGVGSILAMPFAAAAAGLGEGAAGIGASATAGGSAASEAASLGTLGGTGAGAAAGAAAGGGGLAGEVLSKAALDGTTAFGANSVPGAFDLASMTAPATAGGGLNGAVASGSSGASDAATQAAAQSAGEGAAPLTGVPPPANPYVPGAAAAGGTGAAGGLGTISIPGIGNVSLSQLGSLGNIISQLGGSGGSSTGGTSGTSNTGGGAGGLNLGNLTNILGGLYGANQQGNAANAMKSWLQSQQAKIDSSYNPGTPEYNALWDEMSRKDAAAGRNSQYGPRSVDLAARVAAIKSDATNRFTSGTSKAYADSLNQNASRYAGLMGALGANSMGGGNSPLNLSSIIRQLTSGSGVSQTALAQGAATGTANDLTSANDYAGLSAADWANANSNAYDAFANFW